MAKETLKNTKCLKISGNHNKECSYCHGECIKAGKQNNGTQKYQCKQCKKYQLLQYSNKGCKQEVKENILKLYVKNVGIRDVAALLNISINTVIKEIKKYKNYSTTIPFSQQREYEIDEMRTYVKKKSRRRYLVYAIDKTNKTVISIATGRRTNTTLKQVVDVVLRLNPKIIYTDGLKNYKSLIPTHLHKVKKRGIQLIERKNLTARNKLRRLNRKTLAFSKSDSMLLASAKLLFWKEQADYALAA